MLVATSACHAVCTASRTGQEVEHELLQLRKAAGLPTFITFQLFRSVTITKQAPMLCAASVYLCLKCATC